MQTEDFKTSSILEEGDGLNAEPVQRSRRCRSGLRIGLLFVALSAMGMVGLKYTGTYPFNRQMTPMEAMVAFQDKITAFTARALQEKPDFKGGIEAVIKEEKTDDPTAMTMKAKFQSAKSSEDWPTATFTFEAKKNRQDKLKEKMQDIMDGIVDLQCQRSRDDDCAKQMKDMVKVKKGKQSVHFGQGEFVFVSVKLPKGQAEQQADKDMGAAFKEHKAALLAEVNVGRTVEDMFANKDMNVVKLLNGIHVKISAEFASTMFDVAGDMASRGMQNLVPIMKGFAKFRTRQEILYKSDADLGGAFDDIPSFEKEMDQLKKGFEGGPPEITKPMKNLQKHAKGLAGVAISGLPGKTEYVVEFTNFHPSKLLAALLPEED